MAINIDRVTVIWNYNFINNFINKTIVSRLLSGHYRLPGFLRIADVFSSRRAVGIVIYFARFDMYRNVRKGTWLMFMQISSGVLWAQRQTSFPLSCRISRRKHNRAWSRCQRSDSRRGELEGRQIACGEMRERDERRWEKDVKSGMMNSRAIYDRQRSTCLSCENDPRVCVKQLDKSINYDL